MHTEKWTYPFDKIATLQYCFFLLFEVKLFKTTKNLNSLHLNAFNLQLLLLDFELTLLKLKYFQTDDYIQQKRSCLRKKKEEEIIQKKIISVGEGEEKDKSNDWKSMGSCL